MAEIILYGGQVALVDDADFRKIACYSWSATSGTVIYAQRKNGRKNVLLHREIMAAPDNLQVDHINGNGLDNRRANLRVCTRSQNLWNQRRRAKNTSGFKGVNKNGDTWRARIKVNNKEIALGCYKDAIQAAKAYDYAAKKYFGEFAKTNFDDIDPPPKVLRLEARKALRGTLPNRIFTATSHQVIEKSRMTAGMPPNERKKKVA